jgi:hypothetical protein
VTGKTSAAFFSFSSAAFSTAAVAWRFFKIQICFLLFVTGKTKQIKEKAGWERQHTRISILMSSGLIDDDPAFSLLALLGADLLPAGAGGLVAAGFLADAGGLAANLVAAGA